jgi:hypothetical protein
MAMTEVQLLIGDHDAAASSAATFVRQNPISGETATRAAAAGADDAILAAEAAAEAFAAWSAIGPHERRKKLLRAADALEARAPEFISLMMDEIGATAGWAGFNVYLAAQMLREAASMTTQVSGEVIPSEIPGSLAFSVRQPVGVVLGIAPWNAPVILGVRAIAVPLACGNLSCDTSLDWNRSPRSWAGSWSGQRVDPRCRQRIDDCRNPHRPPRRASRELYRLHTRGKDSGGCRRETSEANLAGTGRQSPAPHSR